MHIQLFNRRTEKKYGEQHDKHISNDGNEPFPKQLPNAKPTTKMNNAKGSVRMQTIGRSVCSLHSNRKLLGTIQRNKRVSNREKEELGNHNTRTRMVVGRGGIKRIHNNEIDRITRCV